MRISYKYTVLRWQLPQYKNTIVQLFGKRPLPKQGILQNKEIKKKTKSNKKNKKTKTKN